MRPEVPRGIIKPGASGTWRATFVCTMLPVSYIIPPPGADIGRWFLLSYRENHIWNIRRTIKEPAWELKTSKKQKLLPQPYSKVKTEPPWMSVTLTHIQLAMILCIEQPIAVPVTKSGKEILLVVNTANSEWVHQLHCHDPKAPSREIPA